MRRGGGNVRTEAETRVRPFADTSRATIQGAQAVTGRQGPGQAADALEPPERACPAESLT